MAEQGGAVESLVRRAAELSRGGNHRAAAELLLQAIDARPDDARLRCDLAVALQLAGDLKAAIQQYREATRLDPRLRPAWYNLGCVLAAQDRDAEAIGCFERSIELEPSHAASHHNLGQSLFNLGDTDGAIARYRQAIQLRAGAAAETTLAMAIAVSPSASPQEVLQTRLAWARHNLPGPMFDWSRTAVADSTGRRLRVGYISAFFDHPNWMKPVWALINRHDRAAFQLFLYSDGKLAVPEGYRQSGDDVVRLTGRMSNVDLAKAIHADGLDLLVDLNGYSRVSRLGVLALRPTPRIAGWFNMFATSGVEAVDHLIGDETVVAPGEERDYCEQIIRLPGCYLTFEVTHATPPIAPAPFFASGRFTYGSLASSYKMTPPVLDLWARILNQNAGSSLLLRNKALASEGNRDWLRQRFAERGVAAERLLLEGPAGHYEFLQTYDRIDVALDPFPYNGGTTTSEALWQGVPVIAMHGDRWTSRVSSSLLHAAGLNEFIARDADHYVELAVGAGEGRGARRLADLRLTMRDQLQRSRVCAGEDLARNMEAIYRRLVEGDPPTSLAHAQ